MKTTESQRNVLNRLIFIETYHTLLDETGMQRGALRDDLMQLINAGMIEVYEGTQPKRVSGYDSDKIELFSFRATRQGLNQIS